MVYPADCNASTEGSRDLIDSNDVSQPFILLVRHGSSDHLQPNFPTPGQIRSMFSTAKINEVPEYASSPSSMSDPVEWRPSNQVDVLEERLLRIHQWNDRSAYLNPNFDGNNVNVADVNQIRTDENSVGSTCARDSLIDDTNHRDRTYNKYGNNQCMSSYDSKYKAALSEESGNSDRIFDETDLDYNHREYDVEEYVDQINNFADVSDNSSSVCNDDCSKKIDTQEVKKSSGSVRKADSGSLRQKHIEQFFNLNVNENDNEFIGELKSFLLEKLNNYFLQKNDKNKCSLSDDIRKVADILSRGIADKNSVICDKVHELCLRLRDILILKDEILNDTIAQKDSDKTEENCYKPETKTLTVGTNDTFRNDSIGKVSNYDSSLYSESTNGNLTTVDKDIGQKLVNSSAQHGSFDTDSSSTKFSRIPIAKFKLPFKGPVNVSTCQFGISSKSSGSSRVHTPAARQKCLANNGKQEPIVGISDSQDKHSYVNKQTHSRHSKDIQQQKEEIIKKATVLGLLDGANEMAKIPYLNERAQLALLEKQIQGKLKSKQLAIERRKGGFKHRISNTKLSQSNSKEIALKSKDNIKVSDIITNNNESGILNSNEELTDSRQSFIINNENEDLQYSSTSSIDQDISVNESEKAIPTISEGSEKYSIENFNYFNGPNFNNYQNLLSTSIPHIVNQENLSCGNLYQEILSMNDKITFENHIKRIEFSALELPVMNNQIVNIMDRSIHDVSDFSNLELAFTNNQAHSSSLSYQDKSPEEILNEPNYDSTPLLEESERDQLSCERSISLSRFIFPIVLLILIGVFYIYQMQFLEYFEQWSIVVKTLWESIKIDKHVGEAKKYIRNKCELV